MAQGLERIPLAVDSDFQAQPVRANFPEAPAQDFKLVLFEPDQMQAQDATPAPRSMGTVAADTAYGMAKGAGSLVKGIGWLTGSEGMQQAGQDAEDYWGEKQSADLHRQLEAVGKAEGVSGTVASLWNNPGAIGDYIATSLPMMIPGMAVGNIGARGIVAYAGNAARGAALRAGATEAAAMQAGRIAAEKAAEKAAMRFAVGANMLGEGAVSGGVTGAEVEKFALEHGATPEQAKAAANKSALMAGAWTTAGAGIGAGMETRAMLGRLKDSGIKGMVKNVAKEAAEEAIQNPGEDYAAYAGKVQFDPTQTFDPGKAATLGAITGGAMGAGFHAAGRAGTIMRGEREDDNPDGAIPADDIGAGPGSGGPGAIDGEFIPSEPMDPRRGLSYAPPQGATYDQNQPTLPPGQPLLAGPQPMEGDVLGPESLPAGQALLGKPAIEGSATVQGGEFARPMLPAPEDGGPSERQVSTAIGLLKHSPKASPDLLQRLMRVDQTMATMLFNHWKANGQVTGNQATEIPAPGDQGQGADIAGSRVVGGFSDGAVSFTPGAAAEDAAPGGESGMAMGGAGPDAVTPLDVQAHAAATSLANNGSNDLVKPSSKGNAEFSGNATKANASGVKPENSGSVVGVLVSRIGALNPSLGEGFVQRALVDFKRLGDGSAIGSTLQHINSLVKIPSQKSDGSINPDVLKAAGYSLATDAHLFGNAANAQALRAKGFDGLNVDDKAMVKRHMLSALNDGEIRKSVVELIPVDVMNMLVPGQLSANGGLDNKSMLLDRMSTPGAFNDPVFVGRLSDAIASSLPVAFASSVTEKQAALGAGQPGRRNAELGGAGGAIDGSTHNENISTESGDRDQSAKEVRSTPRRKATASSLLQAIVNRGGISREIMSDVGADPAGRYMPGLFTKTGTTDLSALAGYLFDEDGFHQIRQDSDIGPARELEDLITRALGGEKVLTTAALEKGAQAEETAKLKEKAQRLGVKTVARKLEDIAAEVAQIEERNILDEETRLEDEALVAYNEAVDALNAAIGEDATESFLEDLASRYQDETHLNYLRSATIALQEKLNAQVQSAGKPDESAAGQAGPGDEAGRAQGGTDSIREEARPTLSLSGQSEAEIRAEQERVAAAEAQRKAEDERAAAAERQARIDAEVAGRQDVAADNFTLTPQVNNKTQQKKADQAEIDRQLAGQGDIFGSNSEKQPAAPVAESNAGELDVKIRNAFPEIPLPLSLEELPPSRRRDSGLDAAIAAIDTIHSNRDISETPGQRGVVSTPEKAVNQLGSSRDAITSIDGKLRSGNRTGATTGQLINAWKSYHATRNDIMMSFKENPEMWGRYFERQAAVNSIEVGGTVLVPYGDGSTPNGAPAKVVRKFSKNWKVEYLDDGRELLVEPSALRPGDDGVATIQGGAAADTIAGKPVTDMSDDQLRTIARGLTQTFGETAVDKAKAEINRRNAALRDAKLKESAIDAALRSVGVDPNAPADEAKMLRRKAEKLQREAREMLDGIPPGQPVSSTRDRNLREKSAEKSRKAGELFDRAEAIDARKVGASETPSTNPLPISDEISTPATDKESLTVAPAASIAGKPVSEMSDGMLNQIAKSSQPAAEKAKAEVAKRKKPKADPLAAVREFYTPGNIIHVDYWNQYDKVLEFKEGDLPGQWNVKVQQVKKDGDQWVPKDDRMEPPRWHATAPGKDKIVDRVPTQPPSPADAAREDAQDQARRENPDIKTTLAEHDATVDRLRDGTATLAEYKAAFQRLQNSTEELTAEFAAMKKDDILKHMGGMAASRYKSDTKAQVVTMAVRDLMDDFSIGRGISYTMGGRDAYANAVRAQVERTTDADLAEYAEHVKSMRAAQTERVAQVKAAMKDPKTLDDFEMYLRAKMAEGDLTLGAARMTMTPEQRVAFDELASEKSRAERKARGDQQRADIRVAAATTEGQIIETKHTKTGEPLFVVKAAERVERDVYNHWNATAKKLGGWYSSYRGGGAVPGFQFKTRENADAFLAFIGGNVEQAKEAVQTRRDAFEDDRSQTAVERLTEMADRLEERADESLNRDRKENTDRRARMAASAEAAANSDKSLAKTMRNIAQAIESGKTKFLDRVRQKAQVEMLRGFLHTAKANELRAKFPSYADQEKHRGAAPTAETADYVDFPRYTAFRSDLATMGRQMLDIDGAKKTGAALLKVADDVSAAYLAFAKEHLHQVSTFKTSAGKGAIFASRDDAETAIKRSGFKGKAVVLPFKRGQNIIIMSPSAAKEAGIWRGDDDKRITLTPDFGEEVVAKVKEFSSHRISMPYLFESVRAERARLKVIGIETPAELRSALREFMDLRAAPPEVDKIKQMERAMIGRKNDGLDFFPTPASVADELVQAAGIEEGMAVLEPSAGMGHIAERIRAAGVDPDVVEMASDRRELLEAKGFRLVGSDFMDMTPRDFTYGDVFRAPDGTLGVMRGSGGMGSNRVGLDPLDANGNPEPRRMGWYDRDELEGVKKRAGNSGYDRIIMNPPFSDRRDAEHVQHAYTLLKPGGRLVAIMGEGVFFGQDKKAQAFRDWLEEVGGTSEKLEEGTFLDPSLPVNTGVNARMVVVEKGEGGVIAEPSSAAPGQFTSPKLGTKFANAREAVEWLAQNMDGEGFRHVAQKILPVVRSAPIHYVSVGDTVPAKVAELLSSGSAAVAYQAGDITDGKDAIYILEGKGDTEEGLLHEALHIATSRRLLDATAAAEFSDITKAIRSSLYDAGAKSTDQKFKQAIEFFRREFRSPGELVAYGFSSPAFQDLLKLMAADGKFYTDYRTPEQLAKVNKNASFQSQKRIPTPAYSMWHRFVDAVRALFGGPKAYQEVYERAIAANAAIDRNNELASRVEFKTLEEELNRLLDALLQRPEFGLSNGGAAQPIRSSGLESRSRSTGFASTESTRAIQSVVDKFLKQFAGAADLDIRVVRTVADIPERFRPSPFAEGTFNDDAGLIYLVAMNLKHANGQVNTGRVWQVLMHEAVGHAGLAKMMGSRFGGILKEVMRAARAKGEVGEDIYEPGHPDYATVEAVRLRYTTASDEVLAEEVLARMAETDPGRTLFGYVRAVVRQWLRDMARAAGITLDVTTAELNDLVAQASRYMRRGDGVAQGVDVDALGVADMAVGGMASKATGMESRRAPTAGQPQQPRTGILDTILRKAGGELAAKITGPAYDKLTAYLGGKVPEGIKAGMVSDYGLDESYVDRRTGMQTEQQKAARQTKTFVEGLMDLDRAQSRVAYQWLNNRGAEADRLMAQLPQESQQVLKDIKIQIAKLTIEAVRLGQLDAETAERNFLAYLHRSYARYDLNTDDKTWKAERAKAIKVLGDQYKGRGLKMDVDPDRIHSAPGWWQDEMKGKRVKVLKNAAGRFAFVAEGTAIPPNLSGYKVEGVWEIMARKAADRITLWRDFTQDERQMMGELDEAKYAVARTLFMMNRDIEVGRFHEWVADEYAKTPEEAEDEGLQMADASDSMMRAFTPGEWVTVPTSKIPGTGVFKYGALAGMVVPGPVWNDIRQISAGRFEPFGAAYASILRAWKLSKTALTPTTHVNNIMGNFVMADMHDVGARDAIAAVRLMVAAANGDNDAKAMLDRFEDSGATQGMFTTHELRKEVLEPLLQQLREEVGMADDEAAILKVSAIMSLALHGQFGEAWAGAKAAAKQSTAGRVTGAVVTKAQDYYQAEDSVFRLAAFLKSVDEGKTDLEAGKLARKAFLDYHINAPWINAMRGTAMPFIAFAYRAIPMLVETAARKPWKIAKYMLVAGGLNALAYAMLGADADEDKERAYLPDEKAGRLWGIVPKLIRMPWNRESKLRDGRTSSDPVFLDVRRWIPVGDVVDYGQDKTALPMIPQPLIPGGPMIMVAEFLVNKSAFTGKELTKETDTWVEKAAKVGGHFYKGFMPNVPIPYSGTWAGTKIDNAVKGKEDPLGRAYPVPEAIASGFGLKLERYPVDTLQRNAVLDMKGKLRELSDAQRQAARDYGRQGMTKRELDEKVTEIVGKKNATIEEYKVKERKAMGR